MVRLWVLLTGVTAHCRSPAFLAFFYQLVLWTRLIERERRGSFTVVVIVPWRGLMNPLPDLKTCIHGVKTPDRSRWGRQDACEQPGALL